MTARVLSVAGSDSGGGAGIQADLKTITALGGFAMTAVTAVTVQNTLGVSDVFPVPPDIVAAQIRAVLSDIGADCVKTGMLVSAEVVIAVTEALPGGMPLVVDPVMVSTSGRALLDEAGVTALRTHLFPKATLITPNLPEAESLLGHAITDGAQAARDLLRLGCFAVLLKGGHGEGDVLTDYLADADGVRPFPAPRIDSRSTHGTGCTLASAIATGLAQGMTMTDAVERARTYVRRAIESALALGSGNGPLNHGHLAH